MESLTLKWGTMKGWKSPLPKEGEEPSPFRKSLEKYYKGGVSMSIICQRDTPEQKEALIEAIRTVDGEIWNDWTGKRMTKAEAEEYVRNYGTDKEGEMQ